MPRIITSPNTGSNIVNLILPEEGGHGQKTVGDAMNALGLVPRSMIGQPGGPISLTADGEFDEAYLEDMYASIETVTGDLTIQTGETKEYFLTAYDSFVKYDVRTTNGSVSIERNVITYTAGLNTGAGGFTLNGRLIAVAIIDAPASLGVEAPVITSPVRGENGKVAPLTVTVMPYTASNGQAHRSTTWQCSEYPDFSVIAFSANQSLTNLTSWTLTSLQLGKQYFVRVMFHSTGGVQSDWSATAHFMTATPIPAEIPKITSPSNGSTNLSSKINLTSTAYNAATGDPHASTSWQISDSPTFATLLYEIPDSVSNKTSCLITNLVPGKDYYVRVRYRGQLHGYTDWSSPSFFRTRQVFIPTAEMGSLGDHECVSADMSDSGSAWIVGNGASSVFGSAYIYKKIGLVPVLDDRIGASAPSKSLSMTIPSGGNMTVSVDGRYATSKSYTLAENVTIPPGGKTLTMVGKGRGPAEVSAFLVGTGTIEVPEGVGILTITAKGGNGTTINNPGQPYVAAKPEILMSSSGTFSIFIGGLSRSAQYSAKFSSLSQLDGKSLLVVKSFSISGLEEDLSLELLTNSLGDLPASYSARQELVRIFSRTDESISTLNFVMQIAEGSPAVEEQAYVAPSSVTTVGTPTVLTINGQTYTYPGGNGAAATARTDYIAMVGARVLNYAVPSTGSAKYSYPAEASILQSVVGTGEYVLPSDTTLIRITGRGGSGTTTNHPAIPPVPAILGQGSGTGDISGYAVNFTSVIDPDTRQIISTDFVFPSLFVAGPEPTTYQYEAASHAETLNMTDPDGVITGTVTVIYARVDDNSDVLQHVVDLTGIVESWGSVATEGVEAYVTTTTGASTFFEIQGNRYTYLGGNGGPANQRTDEVILNGSDLSLSYEIAVDGAGSVRFNIGSLYSCSFTGHGTHVVPGDAPEITIAGRGQDGTPAISEKLEFAEHTSELAHYVTGPSGNITSVYPPRIAIGVPPEYITINPDRSVSPGGQCQAQYRRTFTEMSNGVQRRVAEYVHTFDSGSGTSIYTVHYRAYMRNVLLPSPVTWVNPTLSVIQPVFNGKVGTIRWIHPITGEPYHVVTGGIHFENFWIDPEEIAQPELDQPTTATVKCYYRVMAGNVVFDRGIAEFTYSTISTFTGSLTPSNLINTKLMSTLTDQTGYDEGTITSVSTGTGHAGNWFSDIQEGRTIVFHPTVSFSYRPARADLRMPAVRGEDTTVYFNGQSHAFEGGAGVPAVTRIVKIQVTPGATKELLYDVKKNGIATVSYSTASEAQRDLAVTVDGLTYTFPPTGVSTEYTTHVVDLLLGFVFGKDVAISSDGTLAAICVSPQNVLKKGYVLVLKKTGNTWNIIDELHRDDGYVWNAQSVSMDRDGDYIVAGASSQASGSSKIGSFAIYRRTATKYALHQLVNAPNIGVAYEAGSSCSMADNASRIIVGAPVGGVSSSALIYGRGVDGVYTYEATLFNPTSAHQNDTFGSAVYMNSSGTIAAVSSPTSPIVGGFQDNCGLVVIFRRENTGWVSHCEVRHPDAAAGHFFGKDIHLSGDGRILTVGCPGGNAGLGEVLVFDVEKDVPVHRSTIRGSGTASNLNLGKSIALPGSSGDLVAGTKSGIFFFD